MTAALRVAGSYRRCGWSHSFPPFCHNSRHFCSSKKIWPHFSHKDVGLLVLLLAVTHCWLLTRTQVAVFVYLIVTVSRSQDCGVSVGICMWAGICSKYPVGRSVAQGAQPHVRQQDLETPKKGSPVPHHFAGRDKQNVMDRNSDSSRKDWFNVYCRRSLWSETSLM
jgi:hypothetical protein